MSKDSGSLDAVVSCCEQERSAFRRDGERSSPCCLELFRLAFYGDQAKRDLAWMGIAKIFQPLVHARVRAVLYKLGTPHLLDEQTQADIVQNAWLAFTRKPPSCLEPEAGKAQNNDLSPILEYWGTCTKNEVLQARRKFSRRRETEISPDHPASSSHHTIELRIMLQQQLLTLLETDAERLLFDLAFGQSLKPAEIVARYPERYPDVKQVYKKVRSLKDRLRKDPIMRQLAGLEADALGDKDDPGDKDAPGDTPTQGDSRVSGSAHEKRGDPPSLEIQTTDLEQEAPLMEQPCELEDAILFDYIAGRATPQQRSAVDRSSACRQRAQVIADEVSRIEGLLYRVTCPEPARLVDYQERRLVGTPALVVLRHLEHCAFCKEDLAILAAIDAVPLEAPHPFTRIRRAVEALLQPALSLQLRGQTQTYATPDVHITLSHRRTPGGLVRWTLSGELSTPDGGPFAGVVEQVSLQDDDTPVLEAEIEDDGAFILRNLTAGRYRLVISTSDQELTIRALAIGTQDSD